MRFQTIYIYMYVYIYIEIYDGLVFDELMMVFVMMLDDTGSCWLLVVVNPTRPASSSLISSPGATRSPNYQLLGRSADEIWEDFFLPLSFPWDFLVMLEHVGYSACSLSCKGHTHLCMRVSCGYVMHFQGVLPVIFLGGYSMYIYIYICIYTSR